MDYRQASEVARLHPGSVLTRDESGAFVVRGVDGALLGASDKAAASDYCSPVVPVDLQQEIEGLKSQLGDANLRIAGYSAREERLRRDLELKVAEVEKARSMAQRSSLEAQELGAKLAELKSENDKLNSKLAKVSDIELARIAEADRVEQEKVAKSLREQRRTIKCACAGEVEKCARCFGAGEYVVDGFGNQV